MSLEGVPVWLLLGSIVVLIMLSAFFSGTETAMMALNRYRLRHLVKERDRAARKASRMLRRPDRLLGVILVGNNLVNFIAATNRTLSELVSRGIFRQDLFYRLNVVRLTLPPLSNRREDIPLLIEHFIQKFNAMKHKDIEAVSEDALDILMRHDYPGNVRELENFIEYAFVLCHDPIIESHHLPRELLDAVDKSGCDRTKPKDTPLKQAEAVAIMEILRKHGGSRVKAAADLGINKSTLWRKMKKYGITFPPVLESPTQ